MLQNDFNSILYQRTFYKKKIETEVEEGEGALDKQQIEEDLFDQIV